MEKNAYVLALVLVLLTSAVYAGQGEEDIPFREIPTRERVFVGGFVGLQLGTFTAINITITAHAGYRISPRWSAGIGGIYQFEHDRWEGRSISTHVYGGSLFSRLRLVSQAFVHAEYEWVSLQSRLPGVEPGDAPRVTEVNPLLGLGYGFRLSDRIRLNILMMYNFNENSQMHLDNPFFRAGVDVRL